RSAGRRSALLFALVFFLLLADVDPLAEFHIRHGYGLAIAKARPPLGALHRRDHRFLSRFALGRRIGHDGFAHIAISLDRKSQLYFLILVSLRIELLARDGHGWWPVQDDGWRAQYFGCLVGTQGLPGITISGDSPGRRACRHVPVAQIDQYGAAQLRLRRRACSEPIQSNPQ